MTEPTLEEVHTIKSDLMQRALDHLDRDDKQAALCLVMGWMSIDDIRGMVDFWDERIGRR